MSLLFNPRTYDPSSFDTKTRSQLQALIDFFENKGLAKNKEEYYAGEWYWGLDRLHYLEARLRELGLDRTGGPDLAPAARDRTASVALTSSSEIEFFFSLRSPYSA